jgi:DNA-binding response OmpR family regulator
LHALCAAGTVARATTFLEEGVSERILLIDDDPSVHDLVRAYLERDGYIVHSSLEGRDGIAMSATRNAALVIIDQVLPDLPGLQVLREVRRQSEVPIMMVSGRAGVEDRIDALVAGADDYVIKPFSPRELAARVRALLRRTAGQASDEEVVCLDDGRLELDRVRHEVRVCGRPCALTVTEYEVLVTLAGHPGRVYSRAELAYRARGSDYEGYLRTVDAHVKNLRRKIADDGATPGVVETVRGVGYRLGVGAA